MALEIREIDFIRGRVMTADEQVLPIADLFDAQGRRTASSQEAVLCIAGGDGRWITLRLGDYRKEGLQ